MRVLIFGNSGSGKSWQCTELMFMNPGEAVCVANNHQRPWEPHKHPSKARQDKLLPFLLD